MADLEALSIRISASTGTAVKNINKLTDALKDLNAELGRIDVSGLSGVTSVVNGLGSAFSSLRSGGKAVKDITQNFANVSKEGGNIAQVANAAQNMSQAMNSAAQNTSGAASALGQTASKTQSLGNGLKNVSNNAHSAAKSMHKMSSSANSSKGSFKGLFKELTRVSKMMKLMITRMVLRKVIQGVIDGFKNLAQYSSTFDASLSLLWNSFRQLGNSIAAAVSPLLNALAPAINYIIQLFIKAVNVINQFISALTGLGTWTRAKTLTDDYAKSLDKANGSAKALKKTVLGFDELNQLQDNNSGGGGGTSPKDMFEQVPIDPKILNFIDEMKKKIGGLKKYWDAFVKGFKKGLGDDWKDKVALIIDGAARIQKALKDIWNDPEVSKAREDYFMSLSEMMGAVAGTVVRIGLNIGANLAQGIARSLEDKSPEIKEYLVEMFSIGTDVNRQIEDFSLAIGRISDVLVGENAISATENFTNMFLEAFMLVSENAARLGESLVTLITQPLIDNEGKVTEALDGLFATSSTFFGFLQGALKDIRDTLSDVWDAHLSPMFDSLTSGLSVLTETILDAWNNSIHPIIDEIVSEIQPLWDQYLKPIFDDVVHIIGIVGNLVASFFNSVIFPYIRTLTSYWLPKLKDEISIVISIVKVVLQTVSTIIQALTAILRSFLQFFETGFTKGWGEACHELATFWADEWDNMLEKVKGIGVSIVEIVQKIINAIIHGLNFLGDKFAGMGDINIPEWLGGGTFSFKSLAFHIEDVNLTHFITGSGGRGFRNGGFPEDGWFRASHGEIMGRFDNGQSVVASNEQITNGIAQAVFNAMTSAQSSGNGQYINNTIMVDGMVLARAVTKGQNDMNRRYSPTMA